MKKKNPNKRYIVRKYIMAKSLQHALRKEKRSKPDDCWVDDEWKKENNEHLESAIGFKVNDYDEEDFYDGV